MNDPELDRSLIDRALIDEARVELGPTDTERRRLRRSVAAAVGAAVGATAAGATATGTASAAASAGVATWKVTALVVAGLSTAVAGGVAWTVTEREEPSPHRASSSERAAPQALSASTEAPPFEPERAEEPERAAPLLVENSEPAAVAPEPATLQAHGEGLARANPPPRPAIVDQPTPPTGSPTQDADQAPPAALPPPEHALIAETALLRSAPAALPPPEHALIAETALLRSAPAALPPPEHALIAETALLQSAHRALRGADPERALALLNTHAARYPDGVLGEERAATRVLALCALERRTEARAEAAAFLAAHPRSMHAPRVRAACAAP